MGEIFVEGHASKEITCDTVVYTFKFTERAGSIAEAAAEVDQEVERFLQVMSRNGIEAESFRSGSIKTDEVGYRRDDEPCFSASRTLHLTGDYSEANSNAFFALIAKEEFNIEFSRSPDFSSRVKVHQELLRKAMENSKEKAEMIAACAGQKVVGIKKVKADNSYFEDDDDLDDFDEEHVNLKIRSSACYSALADRIAPATITEEASINVIWLTES